MPRTLPRRLLQALPAAWREELGAIPAEPVTRGMSSARLWRLQTTPHRYLKVAEGAGAAALGDEIARTRWLAAQGIRVAAVTRVHEADGLTAMLTDAMPGTPADTIDGSPERVLTALGRGLAKLHALPVHACPFDERLTVRLSRAQRAVERGQVDPAQFDTRNRRLPPRTLLARLMASRPAREHVVVAHGDASLSNMLIGDDDSIGFVDCGHCGRADRYLDLAVAGAEIVDRFGRTRLCTFTSAYGLARWNVRKAAFYADLYELF